MLTSSKRINNLFFYFLFVMLMGISPAVLAQEVTGEPSAILEQQLEELTEANEDMETEDDSYLQGLVHFLKEPLNLNYADEGLLQELHLLSPVQISNLISYRKLLGNFLSIYELQAIPSWDLDLIRKLRPYITVAEKTLVFKSLKDRFKTGESTLLFRISQVLEKSKGYISNSSNATNFYPGSPQKSLIRYKNKSGNLLQYGFTAAKDAGEQFFKGAQKNGFDFYSVHFFVRKLGIIKSLAIGDFTINMGQGLTQWQSIAFNKGAEIINAKRQSDVLRPYNSSGEIVFNRGVGITIQQKKWETTTFISYRKIDGNFHPGTADEEPYISSLQVSGYHRTASEVNGRGSQGQLSFGGNVGYSTEKFHAGINAVHYDFQYSIKKPDYLYNKFGLSGKRFGNYSVDYSYTYRNLHFFGEAATDEQAHKAFINGLLINTDSKASMSFLYRHLSKSYQALYSNAFTENTNPTNESGFYSSITLNPTGFLRIDAYADFYHFPWLKYRTDAPTSGHDYMTQVTYQPDKQVELSSRFRYQNKPINYNPGDASLNPVIGRPKQGWRTQFSYKIDKRFTFRSRIELAWFDKKGEEPQNGFYTYAEVIYKPVLKPFSGNARISYFETDGYESRIYAFENDVLYGYSIPVFFNKGYRYYVNGHYKFSKKLSVWTRFSRFIYVDKMEIGSGLDQIKGNKKSELKFQVIYSF